MKSINYNEERVKLNRLYWDAVAEPELRIEGWKRGITVGLMTTFYEDLPLKPYCASDFTFGLKIRPKALAIADRYIQHNRITRADWVVLDLDYDVMARHFWPDETAYPCPNFEVVNRKNGHSHVFFKIEPAVYRLRQARQKPLRLAAAVERGLTRLFDGDAAYGGLISKNPLSEDWWLWEWHDTCWGLKDLLSYVPEKWAKAPRSRREVTGMGRNVTIFDTVRTFAYREWRQQGYKGETRFYEAVRERAEDVNAEFELPLRWGELYGIIKSITKWTMRHMDAEGMRKWGELGRAKSILTRQTNAAARAAQVKAHKAARPEATIRELAMIFETSEMTIKNYLKA